MTVLQKWLAGLIGLGALYIVATDPAGIASALNSGQKFISGTENTAIRG
jgi:hypothetical protein